VPRFQPEEIFRVLDRHEVEYVVIGGIAATLHGSNLRTGDVDICPSRSLQNLSRLAAALKEMDARIRTADVPDGLPFACDAEFIAGIDLLNLVTRFGDFDISFVPAGTSGYEDLARKAVRVDLEPVIVPVAALEDVIRSKRAAGRPKDLQQLPTLEILLEELRRRGE
jgi:predicted nucleotidyltransferase